MFVIGKNLTAWQSNNEKALLDEILLGTEAFHAIAKELKKRNP